MIPINCREKIIIIKPATILNWLKFCNKIFPRADALAPNTINTNENPKENNNNGIKLTFLLEVNSFNDCPEIYEIYPGIKGKTHGDKKLINPAPKAINNSNIIMDQKI